jgi:hypothetical protein
MVSHTGNFLGITLVYLTNGHLLSKTVEQYHQSNTPIPHSQHPITTIIPPDLSFCEFLMALKRTHQDGGSVPITPILGQILWDALITTLPWTTQQWYRQHDLRIIDASLLETICISPSTKYIIGCHMNGKIDTWSTRPWEISTPKRVQRFTHSTIPLNGQITRYFEPCSKRLRTNSLELETDSSQDSNRTITQNKDKGRAQTKLSNWVRPHTHWLTTTLTKRSVDNLMRDTHINSFHNSIHEDSNVRNGRNSGSTLVEKSDLLPLNQYLSCTYYYIKNASNACKCHTYSKYRFI